MADADQTTRMLVDYKTGQTLRPATSRECEESDAAAKTDGGRGLITVDGRTCYVP